MWIPLSSSNEGPDDKNSVVSLAVIFSSLIPWTDNSWCILSICSLRFFCCNRTYGDVPLEIHVEADDGDEDDSSCSDVDCSWTAACLKKFE